MGTRIFANEYKIIKIGGRLQDDYYSFRQAVLYINMNFIPLFFALGMNQPEDKDLIIDIFLINGMIFREIKKAYITRETERIAKGMVKLDSVLSSNIIGKEFDKQEDRERYVNSQIHRVLTLSYRDIYKKYVREYQPSSLTYFKTPLGIFRESVSLSSAGFEINVDKFIMIYKRYTELDESDAKRQHQEAANTINRFFNGLGEITQEELKRYFIIDSGSIKPNPDSITIENYMRLGYRGFGKSK